MSLELKEILNKSDSELYLILANQLINENLLHFMTPINDDEKKVQSERWFKTFFNAKKLREAVCSSNFVLENTKREEVVASLADIIIRSYTNLPDYLSITLAVLMVRYGLQEYCSNENSSV